MSRRGQAWLAATVAFTAILALLGGLFVVFATPQDAPRAAQSAHESFTPEIRERIAAMAENWPSEPRFRAGYDALDPLIARTGGAAAALFDPRDDYWGLPRMAGYEEVAIYCGACHGMRVVMQQRLTTERWEELMAWMTDKQGMVPLEPDIHARIVSYLAAEFGVEAR